MPKGKNAAALFEVINKSRGMRTDPKAGQSSSKLQTSKSGQSGVSKWWFNRGSSGGGPAGEKAAVKPLAVVTIREGAAADDMAEVPPLEKKVKVDPDRQEINLRLSFTSALIAVVGVVVVVSMAVIIGKQIGQPVQRETTAQLQGGPAHPEVLGAVPGQGKTGLIDPDPVGLSASAQAPRAEVPQVEKTAPPSGTNGGGGPVAPPQAEVPANGSAASAVPAKVDRIVNLNYWIIQSYPEKEDAEKVVGLLASKGIATSIVHPLKGYSRLNYYFVVSADGFQKLSEPEAVTLRKKIDQVSAEQARKDRKWKPLTPDGFKWR